MHKDFNRQKRSMIGSSIFLGIINLILKLAFWLGLFAGGIWILKYFGIFSMFIK